MKPTCSLSNVESAIGAALRLVMRTLSDKDKALFRKTKIKRYWITTSVDQVASNMKKVSHKQHDDVWTRDFTRMYTNLPQEDILEGNKYAMKEAMDYYASRTANNSANLRFKFSFKRDGRATAEYAEEGLSLDELLELIKKCIEDVYFCLSPAEQAESSTLMHQVSGLPMGSKCAQELANLYCYSREAQFIDTLISSNKFEEARKWAKTWRYIDDICGLGRRRWNEPSFSPTYGMDHIDTTHTPGQKAVFLGMAIETSSAGLSLSVQPKGEGWKWIPQRFIDFGSCHTHYTKEAFQRPDYQSFHDLQHADCFRRRHKTGRAGFDSAWFLQILLSLQLEKLSSHTLQKVRAHRSSHQFALHLVARFPNLQHHPPAPPNSRNPK